MTVVLSLCYVDSTGLAGACNIAQASGKTGGGVTGWFLAFPSVDKRVG